MHKRLQIALMAASAIATLLSSTTAHAGSNDAITSTVDDSGHKVFVNDVSAGAVPRPPFRSQRNHLVFWSTTEHRWKAVPHQNVQAATSAAEEVNEYLKKSPPEQNSDRARGFNQQEIDSAIARAASRHNVDPNLVRALVKVESNFNPNAVSRKGAMGLMQLMPATARSLNVNNPFNPEENIDAGVRHLKHLLETYRGDVRLSLAAYNAGQGAVNRSSGVPRFAETQNYVRRITNLYAGNSESGYFSTISREPVKMQRDSRGVLYISNTD
jgi:soluble lytic murein transglycosylase-like protein